MALERRRRDDAECGADRVANRARERAARLLLGACDVAARPPDARRRLAVALPPGFVQRLVAVELVVGADHAAVMLDALPLLLDVRRVLGGERRDLEPNRGIDQVVVGGGNARDDRLGVADVRDDDATAVNTSVEVNGGGGGARQRVVDLLRRSEHLVGPLVRVGHGGVDDGAVSGQPAGGAGGGNELRGQVLPCELRALVACLPVSVVDAKPVRVLLATDVGDCDKGVLVGLVERTWVVAALRDGGPANLRAARQGDRRLRHLGEPLCDLALREVADLHGAERPVVPGRGQCSAFALTRGRYD